MEHKAEYTYDRNKTWTSEEVRPILESSIKERARYLACFYKAMPRDLFDQYAKKALWIYGKTKGLEGEYGNPNSILKYMLPAIGSIGSTIGKGTLEYSDDSKAVVEFSEGCALIEGWKEMGLSEEDVNYLCEIACYGDMSQGDSLGLKCGFEYTMTCKGHDTCRFVAEKIDNK